VTGPRVLFVTPVPPETAFGGGARSTSALVRLLRREPVGADVEVFPLASRTPRWPHRMRRALAALRSLGSRLPSKSLFHLPVGSRRRLSAVVARGRHDLVLLDGGDVFLLARRLPSRLPVLGVAHNDESALFEAQTRDLRRLPVLGRLVAHDLRKLRRAEGEGLGALDGLLCVSRDDEEVLARRAPGIETLALPTTFEEARPAPEARREIGRPLELGFLAKYSWWPNVDAVNWLIDRVLPEVPEGAVRVRLYGPGGERFAGRHPAILVRGLVPDLSNVWPEIDLVVCPMVSGSGINVKLVEALHHGRPVLATRHAVRGLPEIRDPAVVVLESPGEWASFLGGEAAVRLARRAPAEATRDVFRASRQAPRLASFLDRVLAGAGATRP
jgi:glycosyltransferase involved in cell wall biosynthesis